MQSTQTKNSPLKELTQHDIQSSTATPSQSFAHDLPDLPSVDELSASIPDAFNSHKPVRELFFLPGMQAEHAVQVPGSPFTDPGPAQCDLEEDANDINGNMHYVPHDLLYAPQPMPANGNSILARDDATWVPQAQPDFAYTLTATGSNQTALRANLPAPFTFYIPREYVEVESIIPQMIHQKLVDLHGMPMPPPPFFNMPDTRLYAQFISNFCHHKDDITRRYYTKVPRNPCFPDDLQRPRIYPIQLLKQLRKSLERYKDAFPEPLPMVIIRNSEIICMNPPRWYMYGVIVHVPPTEHPPNSEDLEDTLWSMSLKRGVSASHKPHSGGQSSVATSPVRFGNMFYSAEELTYFNFAVNVFMEVPTFPGYGPKESTAAYKGAFILNVIDLPMHPAYWTKLSEDRKMDIYKRAPQLFGGVPTFLNCPKFPAINLHFQNWDMNLLGVLDDLKFGTVDDTLDAGQYEE